MIPPTTPILPTRVRLEPKAPASRRPLSLSIGLVVKPLSRWLVRRALKLKPGPLRSRVVAWTVGDLLSGVYSRRDEEMIRAFSSPYSAWVPPRELEALLTEANFRSVGGVEAGIRALEVWRDAWGDYEAAAKEVFDFGDGRFLILWHLSTSGARSGVTLRDQEWSELFTWEGGLVTSVQQWMSWREGLEAVGLGEERLA